MTAFPLNGVIGIDFTSTATTAEYTVGAVVTGTDGVRWQYTKASAAIARYDVVWIDGDTLFATPITPVVAQTIGAVGFATDAAIASGSYGWVRTQGKVIVNVAASCAKNIVLFTTDTNGTLDDATGSASHYAVLGVMLATTNGGTASVGTAYANNVIIRHTKVYP